ncbi:MAG: hypothetical protein J1G06_01610 [Oscillospiraceae bacterium]|nr:hypothetical protein [Oscillospiraceae bacterium]
MKVYQMIYTSVKHSIAEPELGLMNQPGMRVYSCSQGLTRENLSELMRFSSYRLPKNNKTEYSRELGDPAIPELFPKIFRTLRLADGRFAAIQSVYAGCDINGEEGNFFAHALVFDEYDDSFFPEQYFGSELFRTHLTPEEQEAELIKYMPVLDDPEKPGRLAAEVEKFIGLHKKELTYLINHAVTMLTSENLRNICISTDDEHLTEQYLLALKWLLPRDVSRNTGISTYNVYLPSDKQDRIVFHGTVEGKNNIRREAIESRENCIYVDFNAIDFSAVAESNLFKMSIPKIREEYAKYKLSSVTAYTDWFALTQNTTFPGMGAKLLKFKHSAGDEAFAVRARELFADIDDEKMTDVRFEITKVMYDNISLFDGEVEKITSIYVKDCIKKLCAGEDYDIESIFGNKDAGEAQIKTMAASFGEYMNMICQSVDEMGEKNQRLVMNFIAHLKHTAEYPSWAEMMENKRSAISVLLELAVPVIVTGFGANTFAVPDGWTEEELYELIAYIEASTENKQLSMSCVKFIVDHEEIDWERYGITIAHRKKMPEEVREDTERIKWLLTRVGYEPFQRNSYEIIKRDIMADIDNNRSPFLISRLLSAVYAWQGAYGGQREAKEYAEKIRKLLLELREKEPQCYNYMIPKLAIEIAESQGHYHEIMINTETMPASFWNWFLIGANRARRDDKKMLAYIRIYNANKVKLNRLQVKSALRKVFKDDEKGNV